MNFILSRRKKYILVKYVESIEQRSKTFTPKTLLRPICLKTLENDGSAMQRLLNEIGSLVPVVTASVSVCKCLNHTHVCRVYQFLFIKLSLSIYSGGQVEGEEKGEVAVEEKKPRKQYSRRTPKPQVPQL